MKNHNIDCNFRINLPNIIDLLWDKARLMILIIFGFVIMTAMQSCVDEKIVESTCESEDGEYTGNSITFYLNAGSGFATKGEIASDVESYDNYINKIRILFFEAENNYFLFDAGIFKNFSKEYGSDGSEIYKIEVPIDQQKDNLGGSIASIIRNKLREKPFKVAFLINWPNDTRPDWSYENSLLNPNSTNLKTIHDLHFVRSDNTYVTRYSELTKGGMASDYTGWVNENGPADGYNIDGRTPSSDDNIGSNEEADSWIRKYWDPKWDLDYQKGIKEKAVYRDYKNLWKLWNFGGSFTDTKITYDAVNAGNFEASWKERNGNQFSTSNEWFNYNNGFWFDQKDYYENDGLYIIQNQNHTVNGNNFVENTYLRILKQGGYYGIILPQADGISTNNGSDYLYYKDEDGVFVTPGYGSIRFMAQNSGHLRIKYSSLNGGLTNIRIQRGSNTVREFSTTSTSPQDIEYKDGNKTVNNLEIKITGDEEPIFIYNSSNNEAVIYSIEFISDIYLYETNRVGQNPSGRAIPMYGVQEYEPFITWSNGETKDLSSLPVSLIRSVAKVAVYLPKEAKHVYMRCMNRNARCEPIDVATNTSDTWTKSHMGNYSTENSDDCEWFRIRSYNPWYGNASTSDYLVWLKWYYGSWSSWMGWNDRLYSDQEPPHIFNPRIERSDFCEFIYAGEQNGAYKYILYTPEKGVDDPNDWEDVNSTPKVIHIEYRYDTNSNNVDDNNCYRIYFTNYGDPNLGEINHAIQAVNKDGYEDYEKNPDNLKKHWPIMRNHVYRFYVSGDDGSHVQQSINVRINPWGYEAHESWEEYW